MGDLQTGLLDMRHLLGPLGAERFFADYWRKHAVAFQLEPDFFARLRQEIGPLNIERLAAAARGGTQAWVANEHIAHSVVPVDGANAKTFFEAGASLYFINVPLEAVTKPLAAFLGAPSTRMLASFFLTPGGGGASPHFDAHENFTIQLTGTKRWTVGTAPLVAAPPEGHVLGSRITVSLAGMLDGRDPAPGRAVELTPGALLYIPRGTLHNTEAGEMSWSLNLSYACTMWLDLICTGLRRRLAKSERWRGSVTGLGNADPATGTANALPQLVAELRGMLADTEELNLLCREFFDSHDPGPN
jgi:50S ribosomal protein L16 3-hydroxylase